MMTRKWWGVVGGWGKWGRAFDFAGRIRNLVLGFPVLRRRSPSREYAGHETLETSGIWAVGVSSFT